jgi:hypothetical protein
MPNESQRFLQSLRASFNRPLAWLIFFLGLIFWFIGELAKDRLISGVNRWIDVKAGKDPMETIHPYILWILDHPITWPVIVFAAILVHAYWRSIHHAEFATELNAIVPSSPASQGTGRIANLGPKHNVECIGVIAGEKAAKIGFVNVEIPDQEIGNFRNARVRIRYILASSGEEVALVFPARWIGSDEDEVSVEFVPRYAALAVYIGNRWHGVRTVEVFTPQSEIESYFRRELMPLPSGALRIEATLIGEKNLSLKPFMGILTLGEDGAASFDRTI